MLEKTFIRDGADVSGVVVGSEKERIIKSSSCGIKPMIWVQTVSQYLI